MALTDAAVTITAVIIADVTTTAVPVTTAVPIITAVKTSATLLLPQMILHYC